MKKIKHVTFNETLQTKSLEPFKPLYLLSTENSDQSKQIRIFISSCEKNCYIQEKGNWQELIIDNLLLSPKSKTYCFPVNVYRYLDIPYQAPPYLTLAKNSKHKILLKNLELSEEILQELALPNLEQLDTSAIAKTKWEAEKVFKLKTHIAEIRIRISHFETALLIFTESREAIEKLESDKEEPFTLTNIDEQIKWFKRQKNDYEYIMLKDQIKIQALLSKEVHLKPECYESSLLELRLQKKEISRAIQNTELAVAKLKKVAECFRNLKIPLEDPLIKEHVNLQVQLLEKKKLTNELQLQTIEEKVKALEQEETSQSSFLVTSLAKQRFFYSDEKKNNSVKASEAELKNFTL